MRKSQLPFHDKAKKSQDVVLFLHVTLEGALIAIAAEEVLELTPNRVVLSLP